jgi:hypothetical protein
LGIFFLLFLLIFRGEL